MSHKIDNPSDLVDPICPVCLKQMSVSTKGFGTKGREMDIDAIWRCCICGGKMFFTSKCDNK